MNTSHEPTWACLECGMENPSANFICADCSTQKPTECEECGRDMTPWSETPRGNARIERYICRRCYSERQVSPDNGIDRDEGCDR